MGNGTPTILDVGQCDPDHSQIRRMLHDAVGADVRRAHTIDDALSQAKTTVFDLILVNRILDRDGSEGLELVRRLKADEATSATPVMLVSNYADAQAAARAAGAVPGFGKNDVGSPVTRELIRATLGVETPQCDRQ